MQVIFIIRQDERKFLRMKSTAKQEHNLNFKRNSCIPKMCVDPCPVGSTTSGGDAGHFLPEPCEAYLAGTIRGSADIETLKVVTLSKLTAL